MGTTLSEMLAGTAFLVVLRIALSNRGVAASLRSSMIAAGIGAVAFPLIVYAGTGMAAAVKFRDQRGWPAFRHGFDRYGHASPATSVPRGAQAGVFALACCDLARRRSRRQSERDRLRDSDRPGRHPLDAAD